jgi:hypothetical protein
MRLFYYHLGVTISSDIDPIFISLTKRCKAYLAEKRDICDRHNRNIVNSNIVNVSIHKKSNTISLKEKQE